VNDERVHAVVAAFVPPVGAAAVDIADALAEISRVSRVPVLACLMGMDEDAEPVAAKLRVGTAVPTYRTPEEAVRALATAVRYAAWRGRPAGIKLDPAGCDPERAVALVDAALGARPHGVELDQVATAELLACYGVTLWPERRVTDEESAVRAAEELGWPVALKTTAAHLRHRADLGGVRLDITDSSELRADVTSMQEQLGPLGASELAVQRMAPPGVACVVRSVEDVLFGPVVSFGLGGDASELLGDVSHRIPPLTDVDVADLVRSVRAAPKLFGHRGAQPVDVRSLEDVIARISRLADDLPEVARVELNPVVVSEHGAAVLGAQVRLLPDPGRADTGRRELTSE
jgi:acyl-CoA synthetase (NDP forming)